eukprot:TRINITY_DN65926_c0_g1_i1.p1 TRINITY_DN65926_c0_g1~~TRINITY_DN65926_c0_g1_i1.p1  ORF type:complete len:343 (-),score=57.92 TRINITY_DN65926_c0_g1_i1:93-1097(-)
MAKTFRIVSPDGAGSFDVWLPSDSVPSEILERSVRSRLGLNSDVSLYFTRTAAAVALAAPASATGAPLTAAHSSSVPLCAALPDGCCLQAHIATPIAPPSACTSAGSGSTPATLALPQPLVPRVGGGASRTRAPLLAVESPKGARACSDESEEEDDSSASGETGSEDEAPVRQQTLFQRQQTRFRRQQTRVQVAFLDFWYERRAPQVAKLGGDLANERTLLAWLRTALSAMGMVFSWLTLNALAPGWEPVNDGITVLFASVMLALLLLGWTRYQEMRDMIYGGRPRRISLRPVFIALGGIFSLTCAGVWSRFATPKHAAVVEIWDRLKELGSVY